MKVLFDSLLDVDLVTVILIFNLIIMEWSQIKFN